MTSFPKSPVMLYPFAKDGLGDSADFPTTGSGEEIITYANGIPGAYSIPAENGGVKFTRPDMNRLCYMATIGTYRHQLGWPVTFSKEFSDQNNGYPKGAVLKWIKLRRTDGGAMPEGTAFDGSWDEFKKNKAYEVGDVVENNANLYVCVQAVGTDNNSLSDDYFKEIMIDSVIDLVSTIDNNTHDFRGTGPTTGNGWKYATEPIYDFYPNYDDLSDETSLVYSVSGTVSRKSAKIAVEKTGWLIVSATRELADGALSTVGDILTSYGDVVSVEVYGLSSGGSSLPFSYARQFCAGNTVMMNVPVYEGCSIVVSSKNLSTSEMKVEARIVGTVG